MSYAIGRRKAIEGPERPAGSTHKAMTSAPSDAPRQRRSSSPSSVRHRRSVPRYPRNGWASRRPPTRILADARTNANASKRRSGAAKPTTARKIIALAVRRRRSGLPASRAFLRPVRCPHPESYAISWRCLIYNPQVAGYKGPGTGALTGPEQAPNRRLSGRIRQEQASEARRETGRDKVVRSGRHSLPPHGKKLAPGRRPEGPPRAGGRKTGPTRVHPKIVTRQHTRSSS